MGYEFHKSMPIYLQLIDHMKRKVLNNELKSGEKLPSVREMAIQFQINPNTVQRTYAEMERLGITESRRGHGSFVTNNKDALIELREELKQQQIHNFVQTMKESGFNSSDILLGVKSYLDTMTEVEER